MIPPLPCQPWQTDRSGPMPESTVTTPSYTTPWDTILDAEYGLYKANVLRGQMDTMVIHRPAPDDYETMAHIARILGPTSGFAHSKSEHEGGVTTTGESEQKVPLIPAHETDLIDQTKVIIKRSGIRPILAERCTAPRL